MEFGPLLREKRRHAGRTMAELARVLGVSVPYVSDVERGNRAPFDQRKLHAAADFLGADVDELLTAAAVTRGCFRIDLSDNPVARSTAAALVRTWTELTDDELRQIRRIVESGERAA